MNRSVFVVVGVGGGKRNKESGESKRGKEIRKEGERKRTKDGK